jgi:HEAT repeat protein
MRGKVVLGTGAAVILGLLSSAAAQGGDPLAELLAEGSLARSPNPVPATFLLNEGSRHLRGEERAQALAQLRDALHAQTNILHVMMEGASDMMNSDAVKQQIDYAQKNSGKTSIFKSMLGFHPPPPPVSQAQLAAEAKQAMIDPWVRGIEAARALDQAGDPQGAANFYVNCFQMLQADWVPSACLDGLLGLGPSRAQRVLEWMVDNADSISITAGGGFMPVPPPPRDRNSPPDRAALQLRQFALEGLGTMVGTGQITGEARETALTKLVAYASGKENQVHYLGAAIGLGRSRDPRALDPLRRLAKDFRRDVRDAAERGLAVAFHDEAAVRELRSDLRGKDVDSQMVAAQALLEIGDATAIDWAVSTIGRRRTSDDPRPDIRPQVVRQLVVLGGPHAREALQRSLATGTGNDWLEAWVRVGLLELGDAGQMDAVRAAVAKEDWALDPRGFRSVWRAIKPLLTAVAQTMVSGGIAAPSAFDQVRQAVQVVGNFAAGERGHYLANADARKVAIVQLRCQVADALAVADPPGAASLLTGLLDDPVPAVRLSAARALAALDSPDAAAGVVAAFGKDYGEEAGGDPRSAEVRAALLRAIVIRFPQDPGARRLLATATTDPDPGVRFIALAAQRPAA